jgi:hypothetical protein
VKTVSNYSVEEKTSTLPRKLSGGDKDLLLLISNYFDLGAPCFVDTNWPTTAIFDTKRTNNILIEAEIFEKRGT